MSASPRLRRPAERSRYAISESRLRILLTAARVWESRGIVLNLRRYLDRCEVRLEKSKALASGTA